MNANPVVLEMRSITKYFPGVRALHQVNLSARKGEILALVGENGAGKTTLMKILSGVHPVGTYEGEILVHGRPVAFENTKEATRTGIAIIHQELNLISHLSVGENIFLGWEPARWGIIDWERLHGDARRLLQNLGMDLDPRRLVVDLSVGQQQMVEIAKALALKSEILILDEPTAALTVQETEHLFKILRELRARGVTCIYISHKLEEVAALADRVTVLRDGQTVGTLPIAQATREKIVSMMVGRTIEEFFPNQVFPRGAPVLEVEDLSVEDPERPGKLRLSDITFTAHAGEVVGLAGLMGSGRSELALSIFGAFPGPRTGRVLVDGPTVDPQKPRQAIQAGIALVTEDRKGTGLVLPLSVMKNLTLASLAHCSTAGVISSATEAASARAHIQSLGIKTSGMDVLVNTLSGGNQQKVVVGKWLATNPRVLILDEPTRGVDVGAKVEIYNIINRLVSEGVAVVMISSELPEVLGMSDRILVMHEGRLVKEFSRDEATQENVMHAATGGR
ncbi:sugar ABC transporter ATP-binding protein [bacterium]|nr:sugar ABC transporter ATP-binding protein [bacterium]